MSKLTKEEVRKMAAEKGLALSHQVNVAEPKMERRNKSKDMLIREIQAADGYNACYNSGVENCTETNCLWFDTCQK